MDHDHRSAPVKGEVHGFAALDRCLVDDLTAGTPIRTQYAALLLPTTRRGVTVRFLCILYALLSVSGASSAFERDGQGCVSTALAAMALTDASDADMILRKMQSEQQTVSHSFLKQVFVIFILLAILISAYYSNYSLTADIIIIDNYYLRQL